MVTLVPPELVRVSCKVLVSLTGTLPKLKLDGVAASEPGVVADPESGKLSVEFEASLTMERLPLAGPPDCGLNLTLNVALCPAATVFGRVMPLMINPVGAFACVMVTPRPPELVTVSCRVCELPTCTLPKLKDAGLGVSVPAVAPVPDNGTFTLGSEASLIMEMLPLTAPLD